MNLPLKKHFLCLLTFLLLVGSSHAQNDIGEMHANSLTAMKEGKWDEALVILKQATEQFDAQAPTIFGPRFGWFWYHRGFAELKVGQYDEAMKSFEACYTRYANDAAAGAGAAQNASINMYHKRALLEWANAAKGAEQWEQAIELYKKFLTEHDRTRDKYEPGVLYINVAVCHFKLGQIKEGTQMLETAITNKLRFPTPNRGIMAGFHAMVEAVIAAKDEAALIDFINKNRAHITLDPFEAYDFVPLFMKLANDAKNAEMIRSTFELYSLVPGTLDTVDDIEARLQTLGGYERDLRDGSRVLSPANLKKSLEDLKKKESESSVNEIYAYLSTAQLHEMAGNVRAAFACYQQLENFYPKAQVFRDGQLTPAREQNLYNLVRTASILGDMEVTVTYAERFSKAFPESEFLPEVRRVMLVTLFWEREYEKCIEIASGLLEGLAANKPSEQHEICLFVLGGSYYYTGDYDLAAPLLKEFLDTYPEDKAEKHRYQATLYHQASNEARMQNWTMAAALLDVFINKYPEADGNPYLAFALYDRAQAHYALEENDPSLVLLQRILKEFPGSVLQEMVFNMIGNIQFALEQPEQALASYKQGLETAESRGNDFVASESLYYLISLISGEKDESQDAQLLEYYDQFWAKYGSISPYKAQVAVIGMPYMMKADRFEEALTHLRGVIVELTRVPGTPGLEAAINSYTESYLETHSVEALKDHYYNFPGIDSKDDATRALLRIAVIGVAEEEVKKAEREGQSDLASRNQALVNVLFNDLRSAFNPKDLNNFILVRVGDFLREKTSAPQQAVAYYEEVLGRTDTSYRFQAYFGLADVLGQGDEAAKGKAVDYLARVYADGENNAQKEMALFRMISVLMDKGDYPAATERAKEYLLPEKGFRRHGPAVQLMLAQSYEKRSMNEDAIIIYAQVWATNMGFIQVSAPSILSWADLVWNRNGTDPKSGKSDHQFAYESLYNFVKLTRPNVGKMTDDDRALWEATEARMKQYEAHASVTRIVEEKK